MAQMQTADRFEKNASGDTFRVWLDHENRCWRAEQTTGFQYNFMGIPAVLRAPTRPDLLRDLAKHWGNS